MNKNKIYLFEIMIIAIMFISKYIIDTNYQNIFLALSLTTTYIIMYNTFGLQSGNKKVKKIVTQITILIILLYIVLGFIFGLILGFNKNPLDVNLISIIKNTYTIISIIVFQELIRFIISKKCDRNDKKPLIFITIIFIVFDILTQINLIKINDYIFFITLTTLTLPSIARNVVCSYLSYHGSSIPCIILRVFYGVYPFIFPIYTNYGDFVTSLIDLVVPYILYLSTLNSIKKYEKTKEIRNINKKILYLNIPFWGFFVTVIILISGIFNFQIIAIGSGSMEPNISYGDAVIYEKINDNNYKYLKKNDVIVFEKDKSIVVHRIQDIVFLKDNVSIQTKGDANNEVDPYKIEKKEIVGIVKLKIKYMGNPALSLRKLFE